MAGPVEIRLKLKYRIRKPVGGGHRSNYNGNSGTSAGKHTAHPAVPGYRVKGYKCDPKLNPKVADRS